MLMLVIRAAVVCGALVSPWMYVAAHVLLGGKLLLKTTDIHHAAQLSCAILHACHKFMKTLHWLVSILSPGYMMAVVP